MPQDLSKYNSEALTEETAVILIRNLAESCDPDMDDYHEYDFYQGLQTLRKLGDKQKGLGLVFGDRIRETSEELKLRKDLEQPDRDNEDIDALRKQAFAEGVAAAGLAFKECLTIDG